MKSIFVLPFLLFPASVVYGDDEEFDFGDIKVKCACDNQQNIPDQQYIALGLPPPPAIAEQEFLRQISRENISEQQYQ